MSGVRQVAVRPERYTPDRLVEVAVGVFLQRGYDGTSMEDLARAAGITKSSFYHHVAGKEELLRRGTDRALDALFAVLEEPGARSGRAIERLRHVVRRTADILVAELPYVTLLVRVRGNTAVERTALARRRQFDRRVAELVRQAAAEGTVRTDIDAHLATRLVFGMINSVTEWYQPGRGPSEGRRVAEAVAQLVFAGLRGGLDG